MGRFRVYCMCLGILSVINDSTDITLINSFSSLSPLVLSDLLHCLCLDVLGYSSVSPILTNISLEASQSY